MDELGYIKVKWSTACCILKAKINLYRTVNLYFWYIDPTLVYYCWAQYQKIICRHPSNVQQTSCNYIQLHKYKRTVPPLTAGVLRCPFCPPARYTGYTWRVLCCCLKRKRGGGVGFEKKCMCIHAMYICIDVYE